MRKTLPKRPDLDQLRRQAKALLTDLKAAKAVAARVFIEHLPEAKKMTPARVFAAGFRLADAQSALARKQGFGSWPALARHIQQLRALEGDWRFVTLEIEGQRIPSAALVASRILIDGDCFRTESPEGVYEGVFLIDVEADPATIDIEFVEGPEAGNVCRGLYRLEGDQVTFCLALGGAQRPKTFATSPGSGHALETLRRAARDRPAGVDGGSRSAARRKATTPRDEETVALSASAVAGFDAPAGPAILRMAGEWAATEMVRDGEPMKTDWLAYGSRVTTGTETRVVFGGQTMVHARMRVDESTQPMKVDYLNLAGPAKGKVTLGLVAFEGKDLVFATASPGKPRPERFESAPGSGVTLSRWRPRS